MRKDEVLLLDILLAARRIREHISKLTREEFRANKMASDAVERLCSPDRITVTRDKAPSP
jgi:uncharacterized protein with HEPN domain